MKSIIFSLFIIFVFTSVSAQKPTCSLFIGSVNNVNMEIQDGKFTSSDVHPLAFGFGIFHKGTYIEPGIALGNAQVLYLLASHTFRATQLTDNTNILYNVYTEAGKVVQGPYYGIMGGNFTIRLGLGDRWAILIPFVAGLQLTEGKGLSGVTRFNLASTMDF